jgi:hypothetical protein
MLRILLVLTLSTVLCAAQSTLFENGFESDNFGWDSSSNVNNHAVRVASGTDGITSATGSFHGVMNPLSAGSGSQRAVSGNWGGYDLRFNFSLISVISISVDF